MSFEKLGDLARAQGNLPEALRSFTESKTIRERLAATDPSNVVWQNDVKVSRALVEELRAEAGK